MLAAKACGRMRPKGPPGAQRPAGHPRASKPQAPRVAAVAQASTNGASATSSKPAAAEPKQDFNTMEINGVPYIRMDQVRRRITCQNFLAFSRGGRTELPGTTSPRHVHA